MEGRKSLSGFWDGKCKSGLFGEEEKRKEGKRGRKKKLVGPTIFYPPNVGRKRERKFFLLQWRVKLLFCLFFKRLKNKINGQNGNCLGKKFSFLPNIPNNIRKNYFLFFPSYFLSPFIFISIQFSIPLTKRTL